MSNNTSLPNYLAHPKSEPVYELPMANGRTLLVAKSQVVSFKRHAADPKNQTWIHVSMVECELVNVQVYAIDLPFEILDTLFTEGK